MSRHRGRIGNPLSKKAIKQMEETTTQVGWIIGTSIYAQLNSTISRIGTST